MMWLYLNKAYGILPAGAVERFDDRIAAQLILNGTARTYNPDEEANMPHAPRLGRKRATVEKEH